MSDDDLKIAPEHLDPMHYPTMFVRTWLAQYPAVTAYLGQPHSEKEKKMVRDKAATDLAADLVKVFGEKYTVHWPKGKPIQINLKYTMGFTK